MSLDGTTANCDLEDYPANSNTPAAVTYNNGEVLACGGRDLEDADRCWRFDGSAWSPLPNSRQKHCFADSPSLIVSAGWWVTGTNGSCYGSSTTSEVLTGEAWLPGPTLPAGVYSPYACVVNLNSTHTFHIGGIDTHHYPNPSNKAWLYNWATEQWTETGPLRYGKYGHGCVNLGGTRGVLSLGGLDTSNYASYSVQLYDPARGAWSAQPDLPGGLLPYYPLLLNWEGQMLALFYGEDAIYRRSEETGEWSVLEGVQLPHTFLGYKNDKAVLVPNNFAHC